MRSSEFGIRSSESRPAAQSPAGALAGNHSPLRIPHSALYPPFPTPHSALRTAISLLEVLICIGIVAIGLLSVAALIPVGGVQVQKANVQERKATLGLNAFREFQIRGMDKPPNVSRMTDGTYNPNTDCAWVAAAGPSSPLFTMNTFVTPNRWTANFALPFAIDPLMVSIAGGTVDSFPAIAPAGSPILKRLSLASTYNATQPTYRALADAVFTAADDVVTNLPDDRSQIGSTALDSSNSHRDYNGQFTWLATITPTYLDGSSTDPSQMNQFTLSIVVFDRRMLTTPTPATDEQGQEEIVSAVSATPATVSVNGGEFTLSDSSANATGKLGMVRPDGWIMLTRYLPYATGKPPWLEAKWFRVVAVGNITTSSSGSSRQVTLAGADWEPDPTAANAAQSTSTYIAPASVTWPPSVPFANQNYNTYACLFDGAVAVYQRVIHLQGPSVWNQ
jgi:hypothetical protein